MGMETANYTTVQHEHWHPPPFPSVHLPISFSESVWLDCVSRACLQLILYALFFFFGQGRICPTVRAIVDKTLLSTVQSAPLDVSACYLITSRAFYLFFIFVSPPPFLPCRDILNIVLLLVCTHGWILYSYKPMRREKTFVAFFANVNHNYRRSCNGNKLFCAQDNKAEEKLSAESKGDR